MLAIGTDELTAMRSELEGLLPDTCTILSGTKTFDSMGGWSTAWGTAASNVPCRIDHKSGNELLSGGAVQPFYSYQGTFKYGQTLTSENRILYQGVTFEVIIPSTPTSWQGVVRAGLEKVAHV